MNPDPFSSPTSKNRAHVGMAEACEQVCLALKPCLQFLIVRKAIRQNLNRDEAIQPRISRLIDLSLASGADRDDDLIGP
jgi:hypothetical protein